MIDADMAAMILLITTKFLGPMALRPTDRQIIEGSPLQELFSMLIFFQHRLNRQPVVVLSNLWHGRRIKAY
jgi:hypothetical protein